MCKRFSAALLAILLWTPMAHAADTAVSAMTEDTAPSADDLLYTVNDPSGTPASRKATVARVMHSAITSTIDSSYRPRASAIIPADGLYMQGCTLTTDSALISGGLTEPYITCGDNDAHGFHRSIPMPDRWDGGTITVTLYLVNTNATPANDYEIDFSAIAVPLATALATTISTTGEQPVNIDFDASGTCGGSACTQNALVKKTSAAITVNGTPAGGNLLRIQGQVDATATTTTQVADVKIIGITVEFIANKLSD